MKEIKKLSRIIIIISWRNILDFCCFQVKTLSSQNILVVEGTSQMMIRWWVEVFAEAQLPKVWLYTNFLSLHISSDLMQYKWLDTLQVLQIECSLDSRSFKWFRIQNEWFEWYKCFNVQRVIRMTWLGNGFIIGLLIRFEYNLIRFERVEWLDRFDFDRTTRFYLSEPLRLKSFEWFKPISSCFFGHNWHKKDFFKSTSTGNLFETKKTKAKSHWLLRVYHKHLSIHTDTHTHTLTNTYE